MFHVYHCHQFVLLAFKDTSKSRRTWNEKNKTTDSCINFNLSNKLSVYWAQGLSLWLTLTLIHSCSTLSANLIIVHKRYIHCWLKQWQTNISISGQNILCQWMQKQSSHTYYNCFHLQMWAIINQWVGPKCRFLLGLNFVGTRGRAKVKTVLFPTTRSQFHETLFYMLNIGLLSWNVLEIFNYCSHVID